MKQLTCELCGSTELMKENGVFICQSCGTKYSAEEAKKMIIDGTVDASGSTVKNDKGSAIQNYLKLAENAWEGDDIEGSVSYAEKVLVEDTENYQAWMIKSKAAGFGSSLANPKIQQSIAAARKAIDYAPEEEKGKVADLLASYMCLQIIGLLDRAEELGKIKSEAAYPHIKSLISYWTSVLQLPHVSKNEIRTQIKICENRYNNSKAAIAPYKRVFFSSCIINNNSKPYHITMKYALLPEEMTEQEKSKAEKGGCYVATAVYGSYDCPQVWTLRRYRDHTLAKTWYGRAFIRTYYAISPTLVKWFGKTNWFKMIWKPGLDRMVENLRAEGVEDTPYEDRNW